MKKLKFGLCAVIAVMVACLVYFAHPSFSPFAVWTWMGASFILCIVLVVMAIRFNAQNNILEFCFYKQKLSVLDKVFLFGFLVVAVGICYCLMGGLIGAPLFNAQKYASILEVKEYDFGKDMEESETVTDIALMDTESAKLFGNRKIGSLSDVVSQYEVEEDYSQIAINGKPMKVSALKYASKVKWLTNRGSGIPGYVQVDPVTSEAKYVKLDKGMKYVPSACLNDNLARHVQFRYPTKFISGYNFEVDDNGNPYYVCPCMKPQVEPFSGMDVEGIILCNPVTGDCKYYDTGSVPEWTDCVYSGDLLTQKYDWHGTLANGFWNSIIGQKDCRKATDDFGYKVIGNDVWMYTGVTSVTGDQSNIGFVLVNQRTSEAKYYTVSGADEHSAMASAEGEVQEKGYKASFPSLININSKPAYIMVLKDDAGIVKMYAIVNVEQHNLVATATTQKEVLKKYKALVASQDYEDDEGKNKGEASLETAEITVLAISKIPTGDGTVFYIQGNNRETYKQFVEENEQLVTIIEGDRIKVSYIPQESGIHLLQSFEFLAQFH